MLNISKERSEEIISNILGKRIAVIGDVMLDRYFIGNVTRVSPEAPVPVIDVESETFHLGGAANVANNLKSLGAEPILCGVIGDDNSGKLFCEIAAESGLNTHGLVADAERVTTVKTRIIGNNQHIARLDREVRNNISDTTASKIASLLSEETDLYGIIFEDYNKGVLTKTLIQQVQDVAHNKGIEIFVDPKFDNFFAFTKPTVFKPNRKEAQEALGYALRTEQDILKAGKELLERLQSTNVLLTLGAQGMMLFESSGKISSVPTFALHVADVSGAGDTAIATLVAAMSGGADVKEAAILANYAAGVVCGEPGVVSIRPDALAHAVIRANELLHHDTSAV
ncbi:MAG: bifunctional hydroxymethylpyrimidine kinase/phosphomethylpyrimidine kinase [Candidatus Kapabacteria bacterium]|nr:bifunctional hydroxymethylpyrimidine kinase/phosphomethylpyrimidine kinase [Candidatus Kapabacteria bacterium]